MSDPRETFDGSLAQIHARHQLLIRNNDDLLEQLISKQLEVMALEKLIDQLLEEDSDDQ
jgi:hypothetical protein